MVSIIQGNKYKREEIVNGSINTLRRAHLPKIYSRKLFISKSKLSDDELDPDCFSSVFLYWHLVVAY